MEQLRFNISEKIRLHPQQAGISSLLELDLYPDVEIKDEGQHLKIHGYLRLNGTYEGDLVNDADISDYDPDELDGEEIAYVIPVEITLPRNRAELAYVSAEVESFDYQLLSPFELQIEAILMIDGILPEQEVEELITEISDESQQQEEEEVDESPSFAAKPAQPEPQNVEPIEDQIQEEEPSVEREIHRETRRTSKEQSEEQVETPQPVLVIEEEGHQEESEEEPANVDEEEPSGVVDEEVVGAGDWSRWLVGTKEDSFTSMKMVIVQKEDSIDTLAAKYGTSCDAIPKTNQFATDRLVEGQIVKIPVKRN